MKSANKREEVLLIELSDEPEQPKQAEAREETHGSMPVPEFPSSMPPSKPSNNGHTLPETSSLGTEIEAPYSSTSFFR